VKALASWLLGGVAIAVALLLCMPPGEVRAQRIAATGASPRAEAPAFSQGWEDVRLLAEVRQRVRDNYVQPVDRSTLTQRSPGNLVAGLDEYSSLLDPGAYEEIKVATSGGYAGIGIQLELQGQQLVVTRVIPDSPAAVAGLRSGDVLEAIDGRALAGHGPSAAALRGAVGTPVSLRVQRDAQTLEYHMHRAHLQHASVQSESLQAGIGYLRISRFTDTTANEFCRQLAALRKQPEQPLSGLVIDLRDNPGGVLDAAVAVADQLLEGGVIVSADGRSEDARFIDHATPGDASGGVAIAVLVNGNSASAAEILAAALHDNSRALLIGHRTYGKGSVQTILPLSGGRALKLTTSRYYTPAGVSLDHNGIVPDVELTGIETDTGQVETPGHLDALAARDPEVGIALQQLREQRRPGAAVRMAAMLR